MQTHDVTKLLGINRECIKYFKKQNVFTPESPSYDSKNAEYTEKDVEALRKLVVLTKSGLTCGDIKKVQDGEWTLQRRRLAYKAIHRKRSHRKPLTTRVIKGLSSM